MQPFVFELVCRQCCEDYFRCGAAWGGTSHSIAPQHVVPASPPFLSNISCVENCPVYSKSPSWLWSLLFTSFWLKRSQGARFGMSECACVYLRDSPDGNAWLCFCGLALSPVCMCVSVLSNICVSDTLCSWLLTWYQVFLLCWDAQVFPQ